VDIKGLVSNCRSPCGRCRHTTVSKVGDPQQHIVVICVHCGAPITIDKDAASRIVAELELHGPTQTGHPTIKQTHPR
jgi:hypothetical protein